MNITIADYAVRITLMIASIAEAQVAKLPAPKPCFVYISLADYGNLL